ncbi:uncharacterized protein PFLUO_LOCUS310 [Penicillium psychrofluorescens]|uniref:uncharacterized protein n=1 Tax=Penicillium psychrofluorescens TaxID=3158075 RepID=UPI003CCD98D9
MPDEGGPHERTIMAWPGNQNLNYQGNGTLVRMKNELTAIAKAISDFEPVTLLVSQEQATDARRRFERCGQYGVEIEVMGINDLEPWMRDAAPTFVFGEEQRSDLHGVDFNFNGWGGRYPSDNAHLARQFLRDNRIPRVEASIVLEGGALETDGEGTLMATKSSILNSNRNPGKSQKAVEEELNRVLGVSKVIWVPGLRKHDVTDDHIDALARFVAPGKVALSRPAPGSGVWAAVYNVTKNILSQATDAKGQTLQIIDLPEADTNEADMVVSYVNYYLVNGGVICPRFGSPETDENAKRMLHSLFPEREIVQVYIHEIALNGGGIHCMTQQIPASEP